MKVSDRNQVEGPAECQSLPAIPSLCSPGLITPGSSLYFHKEGVGHLISWIPFLILCMIPCLVKEEPSSTQPGQFTEHKRRHRSEMEEHLQGIDQNQCWKDVFWPGGKNSEAQPRWGKEKPQLLSGGASPCGLLRRNIMVQCFPKVRTGRQESYEDLPCSSL